ncbi:MAG TPA: DUF885 family protein, partial [Acidimicrobiales bacterium]|nr:DUF885 family protein [Acidimicrobiales bacterium]
EAAREHLARGAYGELADSALGELDGIEQTLAKVGESLAEVLPASAAAELSARLQRAIPHLVGFRRWLAGERASMQPFQAIGREAFAAFLTGVAHVPYTPDEMLVLARQEIAAASVWEVVAEGREGEQRAASSLPVDAAAQCERERVLEHEVRAYYEAHGLLSQPASLRHYYNLPRPGYLTLLRFLGVTDDLTDPSRRGVDATSYVPEPGESLAYFYRANAVDPRLGIVHEGVHSEQLALSWGHADPLRREYCDSTANEGIAFYNEELMLQAGLFEDNRQATRVLHNFMRLRAMRVVVDVRLALGEMSIEEAGEYLEQHVPMDRETALHEAAFFAATPGQGLSYQVGKWQIEELLAAALAARPDLGLRRLHDYLWLNGNVPPGLLLPELLALAP